MATATVENKVDKVEERKDYVVYKAGIDKESKKPVYDYAEASAFEDMVKEGKVVADAESFRQTVSFPIARSWEGIQQICPDEEEACNNFNRGTKSKAINRLKARLLDTDDDGNLKYPDAEDSQVGGVLDLTAEIASPTKRKGLTVDEKLDRFLASINVPEALKETLRNTYRAAMASGQSIPGMEA